MSHPRVYWTADRSALVEEDNPRAAYLAYGVADQITPEHLALLGKKAAAVEPPQPAPADEPLAKVAPAQPVHKSTRRR